jgi:hypothetical protein
MGLNEGLKLTEEDLQEGKWPSEGLNVAENNLLLLLGTEHRTPRLSSPWPSRYTE